MIFSGVNTEVFQNISIVQYMQTEIISISVQIVQGKK